MRTIAGILAKLGSDKPPEKLGDFTTTLRVIPVSLLAVGIGALSAPVALALLRLIGLLTNLFFFGRWGTALVSPAGNRLGPYEILVPVAGSFVVGLMARYGSELIRGHGVPEAIESILVNGAKIKPRLAFLKPLASAIAIGSGGPFGAEGPIIMTGGAFGSMIAQMFRLSSAERKTLLAAGAAGGMSATFASPVAGVLLAVEILLFEWKPRSLVPVALASATATALRWSLLGTGPLFPVTPHPLTLGPASILGCVVAGVLAGALSILVTVAVYAAEDAFHLLPIHWMWWPPIGGLAVGLGGLFFPQALGVGYDVIASLLKGDIARNTILGILVVKATIWAVSLSSGTSGGVLAPLLMMGGALGGIETAFLPNNGPGFWQLVGMGATLGATMRTPLTAVVFAIELTRDVSMMFPLLVAVTIAHAVTVLALRRSILTEKVARRGYHLSCEYAVDPLEVFFVREIMRTNTVALPASMPVRELAGAVNLDHPERGQFLYPVVDEQRRLSGTLTRNDIERLLAEGGADGAATLADVARKAPLTASPDEPVRLVVNRMVETGRTRMPVVERDEPHRLLGMIAFDDVLKARTRSLAEERYRERVLRIHFWGSGRGTGRPPSRVA